MSFMVGPILDISFWSQPVKKSSNHHPHPPPPSSIIIPITIQTFVEKVLDS